MLVMVSLFRQPIRLRVPRRLMISGMSRIQVKHLFIMIAHGLRLVTLVMVNHLRLGILFLEVQLLAIFGLSLIVVALIFIIMMAIAPSGLSLAIR